MPDYYRAPAPRLSPYGPSRRRSPMLTLIWVGVFAFVVTMIWWVNRRNPGTTSAKLDRLRRPIKDGGYVAGGP